MAVSILVIAGCRPAPQSRHGRAAPVDAAEAERIADGMVATWTSRDLARIKHLYSSEIVGFDYSIDRLITRRAAWDAAQDAYILEALDGAAQVERTIQIIGTDTFVVSGTWNMTSATKPRFNEPIRCTDVFKRRGDGQWFVVNEHCSAVPR